MASNGRSLAVTAQFGNIRFAPDIGYILDKVNSKTLEIE
jgi:hypothetical protein